MKFKPSIYSICALLALLAASCTREPLPEPGEQEGGVVIIEASIPPETRVLYTDSNTPGSGGSLGWQIGDQLLLAGYDGTTYLGSKIFDYMGTGNKFSGTAVDGATTYKAYYPGNVITPDANGEVQLPADFWQQTQTWSLSTDHLRGKLLLIDTEANALNQSFGLTLQSSIIKFALSGVSNQVGKITKLIWTVETTSGLPHSAILNFDDPSVNTGPTISKTLYLAFDPTVMNIKPNGGVKITLIGTGTSYEYSTNTTKTEGMTYEAGKRYTATVSEGWTSLANPQFRFNITTTQDNQRYEIWQKDASSTSPAELTISWGDGTPNTPIAKNASLAKTIADHTYASPGNYTITITSDQVDPTVKQMPQIIFYNGGGDQQVTAILDPFPNMGATSFRYCFELCSGLTQIPADLFKHNTQATDFNSCFYSCSSLTEIPADLFKHNTQATNFGACFFLCSSLTEIPADLFKYNTQAIMFMSCFGECTGLTSIPDGLFDNNTEAQYFYYCFINCSGLKSIPPGLFDNNTEAILFYSCFFHCTQLTSIPADLFRFNTKATSFFNCFNRCSGLTTIPADLFRYNTEATTFLGCFYGCSGLTTIPADLFRYNTKATEFNACFEGCSGLTTLPADLFGYNTEVTTFKACFNGCSGLTTLPADLFRYNTKATNFNACFQGCTKLQLRADIFPDPETNPGFFEGRTMNFKECFRDVGSYYHPTPAGTAPKLWGFTGGGRGTTWTITDCFTGANVVNRNVIPKSWGGDLADLGNVTNVDGEDW